MKHGLRGHAPLMALLGTRTLRIDHSPEQTSFTVLGGFLEVVDDTVTVLRQSATAAGRASGRLYESAPHLDHEVRGRFGSEGGPRSGPSD